MGAFEQGGHLTKSMSNAKWLAVLATTFLAMLVASFTITYHAKADTCDSPNSMGCSSTYDSGLYPEDAPQYYDNPTYKEYIFPCAVGAYFATPAGPVAQASACGAGMASNALPE